MITAMIRKPRTAASPMEISTSLIPAAAVGMPTTERSLIAHQPIISGVG